MRRSQNYPQSRDAWRKAVERGAFLFYGQSVPTERPPRMASLLIDTLPTSPPSLSLLLETEHNSEQSVKMTPTTSICRRHEIYLIGWRSSRWEPGGGTAGVGDRQAHCCWPGEFSGWSSPSVSYFWPLCFTLNREMSC